MENSFDPVSLSGIAKTIDIISDKLEMEKIMTKTCDSIQKEVSVVKIIIPLKHYVMYLNLENYVGIELFINQIKKTSICSS